MHWRHRVTGMGEEIMHGVVARVTLQLRVGTYRCVCTPVGWQQWMSGNIGVKIGSPLGSDRLVFTLMSQRLPDIRSCHSAEISRGWLVHVLRQPGCWEQATYNRVAGDRPRTVMQPCHVGNPPPGPGSCWRAAVPSSRCRMLMM